MNPKSPIKSYEYTHFKGTNMFLSKYSIILLVIYWYKIKFHRWFLENWCSKSLVEMQPVESLLVSRIETLEGQGPFWTYGRSSSV